MASGDIHLLVNSLYPSGFHADKSEDGVGTVVEFIFNNGSGNIGTGTNNIANTGVVTIKFVVTGSPEQGNRLGLNQNKHYKLLLTEV